MGKAHNILIDFDNAAWHCSGPGQCFRRDPRTAQLAGALFVEVISAPNSHQDLRNRLTGRDCWSVCRGFLRRIASTLLSWATTERLQRWGHIDGWLHGLPSNE